MYKEHIDSSYFFKIIFQDHILETRKIELPSFTKLAVCLNRKNLSSCVPLQHVHAPDVKSRGPILRVT